MVDPSPLIEVRRSTRRRRTVAAYRDGDKIVILMPARTSKADEQRLVAEMVERVTRREARAANAGLRAGDNQLLSRARQLSDSYLDGRPQPSSVRWVRNMNHRWGSCTIGDRTIRLSHRLQSMPSWVIDYVLVHELCHLIEPGHDRAFWAWAQRYPRTDRARGFLEGVAVAAQLPELSDCDSVEPDGGSAGRLEPVDGVSWPGSASAGIPAASAVSVPRGGSASDRVASAAVTGAAASAGVSAPSSACSPAGLKVVRSGSSSSGICRSDVAPCTAAKPIGSSRSSALGSRSG
jgi:predicted metal-dependent hydrolase